MEKSWSKWQGHVCCCTCFGPQVPFQMENSFALLLWDSVLLFFFIALGFAVS